jgi:glycosyltransferase involved in cell wall biosynthesis
VIELNVLFVVEVDWQKTYVLDVHNLSESLSILGHNVFIIDFPRKQPKRSLFDLGSLRTEELRDVAGRANSKSSVTIVRPGFIRIPMVELASALISHYLAIEMVIKRYKIDAIVLYSVSTNGIQTIRLAKKYGIPVVFRSLDRLHELVPYPYGFLSPITFSLETWVYSHVDKILPASPNLSDYTLRMNADKEKIEFLSFGVDMNNFSPFVSSEKLKDILGLAGDDRIIEFVGTLFEFCGLDSYMEQFSQVVAEVPKAKLLIVGDGPLKHNLKELANRFGLEEHVILAGFQPFDIIPQYINLADICISPFPILDVTRDIMPGKIAQYLACGKPVLATPLPGTVSLISGPEQGIVYSDLKEFGKHTVELLKDPARAKEIGWNGYNHAKTNYSEEKLAYDLERILDRLIKSRIDRKVDS